MLDEVVDERVDARRAALAENADRLRGERGGVEDTRAQRVVDVMVEVGETVGDAHDRALERRRSGRAAGVAEDPVADLLTQVQAAPVAFERVHDAQRLCPMVEVAPEALAQAAVEHVLPDVTKRRMAEVVAEPDRLSEVLVQGEGPRDGARDPRDLEGVGQAGAVVVALGGDEHLGLVLETAKRLAVDDPVAVALKRRAQPAVVLGDDAEGGIRARRFSATATGSST